MNYTYNGSKLYSYELGKTLGCSAFTYGLISKVFIWIGKDANEVEKTESVKSGERLLNTFTLTVFSLI